MNYRFETYPGENSLWYWRLYYDQEIIATGHQSYTTRQGAVNGADLARKCPPDAPID